MANFKGTIITTKGHALIAKAVANTATINFTRAATSSHDYTSSTNSDLESLINLSDIKQYSTIDKVEAVNTSYKVFTKFTNKDLTDGYYVRAIGLFATDPQDGEILYSVTIAENADWFPADNGVNCSGINLDLNTGISNTSNVTLNVNYSAYATLDDIEKVNASLSNMAINALHPPAPFAPLVAGQDNADKIQALCNYINSIGGGVLYIPQGTYFSNPFTIPPKVVVKGAGMGVTVLKLNNSKNSDFVTLPHSQYSGIIDCTLDGNQSNNSSGSILYIYNDQSDSSLNSSHLKVEHIDICFGAENGVKVTGPSVWVFALRFIKIESCWGYGIYNTGTDNSFYMIDIFNCTKGAVYNSGSNNRFIGGKWYTNGDWQNKTTTSTLTCTGTRNIYMGIEMQDNYGDGITLNGASYEQFNGILIDACGVTNVSLQKTGLVINNSHDIQFKGTITNYVTTQNQYQGLQVDSASYSCYLDIDFDTSYITTLININQNANDIFIKGNGYVSIMGNAALKTFSRCSFSNSQSFLANTETVCIPSAPSTGNQNRLSYNTSTGQFTIQNDGWYIISFSCTFSAASSAQVAGELYSGTTYLKQLFKQTISNNDKIQCTYYLHCNKGDLLSIKLLSNANVSIINSFSEVKVEEM